MSQMTKTTVTYPRSFGLRATMAIAAATTKARGQLMRSIPGDDTTSGDARPGRNERLFLSRMEGPVLRRRAARLAHARGVREAPPVGGDQRDLLPHAAARHAGGLAGGG